MSKRCEKYTGTESRKLRARIREHLTGKVTCWRLLEATATGRMTREQRLATLHLEIRCPLHESGECDKCDVGLRKGRYDLFEVARDLGIVADQEQLSLF